MAGPFDVPAWQPKLGGMRRTRAIRTAWLAIVATFATFAACERGSVAARADSSPDSGGAVPHSNRGSSNWDPELGALFVVPSDTDNVAVVLFPDDEDAGVPATARVTLLGPGGDTAQMTMSRTDSLQCGDAPM